MRTLLVIITLTLSNVAAYCRESTIEPVLSFNLTATDHIFTRKLEEGLWLRVERNELGWEVGVFRSRSTNNLLYPMPDWHGAYPSQLSAWSQRTKTFPDERIIPVRGFNQTVRIQLIEPMVSGEPGNEKFSGGRVEIFWNQENDA